MASHPDNKKWRRLRVVVEVPVLGDYTEGDLRYNVERLVGGARLMTRPGENGQQGRVEVKRMSSILGHLIRERIAVRKQQIELLNTAQKDLEELEEEADG